MAGEAARRVCFTGAIVCVGINAEDTQKEVSIDRGGQEGCKGESNPWKPAEGFQALAVGAVGSVQEQQETTVRAQQMR